MIQGEIQWDRDLILDMFEERDANLINATQLRNAESDTWYWTKERFGAYSIPLKVKHFLWRAATECLPNKDKLRMKKVEVNILRPNCNASPEIIILALVEYSFANACMQASGWKSCLRTRAEAQQRLWWAVAQDNIMATQGKKRGKTLFSFFKPSASTPTNEVYPSSNIDIEENPSSVDIEENQCDQPICKSPRVEIDLNTLERDPGIRKPIWQHPIYKLAEKFYPEDFTEQEMHYLKCQLEHYKLDVIRQESFQNMSTINELCRGLVETSKLQHYNLIDRLIRLVLTLPISTATTEHSFSAMKLVKTALRNKMEEEFLTDSMMFYSERDLVEDIDSDSIIDEFYSIKNRRLQLK
ncbi:hypothetical protein POM88_004994 [Heracleum sosnowskyi]|uniref:HAT C-terminal dimerisation domain-containing protein n=1 Tax=Heracleum sosnowskyi TaxID=360622 RepID=A0AAD8JKZ9_9APIA|nr:hypothetical protein POM88_004994 [Heracleum sosnowskyi]